MFLAGVPVADRLIPELAGRLRGSNLHRLANRLQTEHEAGTLVVGLELDEREAILGELEDCPPELTELRAVLLQAQVDRKRAGLA